MKPIIFCLLAIAFASAQTKQRVAVLPSVGELEPQRLNLLTDKVREIANKTLPMDNFLLLRQDAVIEMIGSEDYFRACKEGTCIGELAKKANANYGARCDVFKIDGIFVIKFELYSVKDEAILETFTDYNAKDFFGMLSALEKRLSDAFGKMLPRVDEPKNSDKIFTDIRDGKKYNIVKIGSQTWMAENLNYNANGSKCYYNKATNCVKYGRLYDWNTAMKACPQGWHLPTNEEWDKLYRFAGTSGNKSPYDKPSGWKSPYDSESAGKHLKATSGWNWNEEDDISGNGLDTYGFATLPGGRGRDGSFDFVDSLGVWWSASEYNASDAYSRIMIYNSEDAFYHNIGRNRLLSVRCVKD